MNYDQGENGQVLIIDDFFSAEALAAIEENNYEKLWYSDQRDESMCSRVQAEIACDPVEKELAQFITAPGTRNSIRDWADLSWRYVYNELLTSHNVYLSRYTPRSSFMWHADHWTRRAALVFMLTLSDESISYLHWNTDAINMTQSFEPFGKYNGRVLSRNRMFIMPSYYPHRLIMGHAERVSIHGYFNV